MPVVYVLIGFAAGLLVGAAYFSGVVDRLYDELFELYSQLEDVASKIE